MSNADQPVSEPSRRPGRSGRKSRTLLAFALGMCLCGMLHYLSSRHYVRQDISRIRYYGLSEKTLNVLRGIAEPMEIILLFQSGQEGYVDIENLLKEYEYHCRYLRISRVDPDRDPARTREILATYPVTQANVVILAGRGGHRIIERDELFQYSLDRVSDGGRPTVSAFSGEQRLSSAIDGLLHEKRPVAYFIEGHGERPIESFESRVGYAEISRRVRQENVDVRPLQLGEVRSIPADCDVLVIAGPRRKYSQPEIDLIGEYLSTRSGRLVALLDSQAQSGLEPLLLQWGVRVGEDVVVDPARTVTGRELFLRTYGNHPISLAMAGLTCVFTSPRSVEKIDSSAARDTSDVPVAVPLGLTSPSGWAESDVTQRPMAFNPAESDRAGPISVAVAVEKGLQSGPDVHVRPSRLVVMGDSAFLANENIVGGNADLFLSALHWMMDRPELMAISPRSNKDYQLVLTASQVKTIGWTVLLGLPALAAAVGCLVAWRRSK